MRPERHVSVRIFEQGIHAGQRIQLRGEIQYVEPLSEYHSFLMAGNRLYLHFTERACNRQ